MGAVIERTQLAPGYEISRVIKGGWQLAQGHGGPVAADPVADMFAFAERGIDTFDCADIYTGVEDAIGRFNAARAAPPVRVHTKYVPDYDELATLSKSRVEARVDRSLRRLRRERLDMLQFHWWNYDIPGWLETARWLQELQEAGKIELLSLTNFNSATSQALLEAGLRLSSTQVQYSLLDPRPEKALTALCRKHGMRLLCYGTLAGGFLSERWLGASKPQAPENRSLVKYLLIIEEIGGWALFQELLATLEQIARRHDTDIASVASRWVLDRAQVAAVIIGARNADHLDRYSELFRIALDDADRARIDTLRRQMRAPDLDVFDLERDKNGRHGRIMRYNLSAS